MLEERLPRATVTQNPYSVNDCITRGQTRPLNDMFTRVQNLDKSLKK